MESSFSAFPIIIEDQPGLGSRHGHSTFVRAHVMERYHRQRKTNISTGLSTKFGSQKHDESKNDRLLNTISPKRPALEEEVCFIEYAAPPAPSYRDQKKSEVENDTSNITIGRSRKLKMQRTAIEPELSFTAPEISKLRLRDPRIEQSLKFTEIFKAYFQILETRQTPLDRLSKSWLSTAFADLALFHAIMFNFSQHLYALCSIHHEKPDLLTHKVGAIREISARMDSPVQGCSDAVIASILCLVSHEILNGDLVALKAHIRGLRLIINIRGGVHMLGLNGTLKTVYLNYELLLSTVFKSWATNLPPLSLIMCRSSCVTISPITCKVFTIGQTPWDTNSYGFSNASIQMLCTLEQLFSHPAAAISVDIFADLTESSLSLKILGDEMLKDEIYNEHDHVLASLLLAMLLNSSSLDSNSTLKCIERLKNHLNETSIQSFWHPFPGALIFCLIVGMATSKNTLYRPWFVANLMRVTTGLAFENWEGLKQCLYCFSELGIMD